MPKPTRQTPTAEEIAQHVSAMRDSASTIESEIANEYSEEVRNKVKANVDHLVLMLSKDFIISDPCDKAPFNTAVADSQAFLDANS